MLRVIGDVHSKFDDYLKLTQGCEKSIQIGDFGLSEDMINYSLLDAGIDPIEFKKNHKFFGGNHDFYPSFSELNSYGPVSHGIDFFYVRGGWSIDMKTRIKCDWHWSPLEELNFAQMQECLGEYTMEYPNIVLSHECPSFCLENVLGISKENNDATLSKYGFPAGYHSNTSLLLTEMYNCHEPDLWVFGHFHKHADFTIGNTRFVCLPELGFIDL